MTFRLITAHMNGDNLDSRVLDATLQVANSFGSHIVATCALPNPRMFKPPTGISFFPEVYKELARQAEGEWTKSVEKINQRFESWCESNNIPKLRSPSARNMASIEWCAATKAESLGYRCPPSDLLVTGALRDGDAYELGFELALVQEGRPVLFVPNDKHDRMIGGAAFIAWNGSAQSFHAVKAALPILKKAKSVHVSTIAEKDFSADLAEELIGYLGWHGIDAERFGTNDASPERALDAALKKTKSDLLVMGAYTHSRLKELVFGGVTRHFLDHAKIPVLMAH